MKKAYFYTYSNQLLFILTFFTACSGQENSSAENQPAKEPKVVSTSPPNLQIAEYIRHIFQDKNGNFWFGTNGYGVAHYDGDSVTYFSIAEGFNGHQITGVTEDLDKNIWFATDLGVVKYDWSNNSRGAKRFINYTDHHYFRGQRFWSIFADSKNNVWGRSVNGIYRFDGVNWASFVLPYPKETTGDFITQLTTWSISEDRRHLWFSTNGYGAYKYDGDSFTQYTEEDGLTDNSIDVILEDRRGNIWFGTRFGGLSRFDGEHFVNYTQKDSIGNDEVCAIYEDRDANIWLALKVTEYIATMENPLPISLKSKVLGVRAVQAIFEDKEGRLWVGGGVDFIDMMVIPFLILQRMDHGNDNKCIVIEKEKVKIKWNIKHTNQILI